MVAPAPQEELRHEALFDGGEGELVARIASFVQELHMRRARRAPRA